MKYYEQVEYLPQVPDYLIDDLDVIRSRKNAFDYPQYEHVYASYVTSQQLHDFLQEHFNYPIIVRYQVIGEKLPVHVDIGVTEKYNYIIDSGGSSVITRWWDSKENPTVILSQTHTPERIWHKLCVNIPHDITEVTSPRISIQVKEEPVGHIAP